MVCKRKLVENGCLKNDRDAFIRDMRGMGYKAKTLQNYELTVTSLEHFMHERNLTEYSTDIGKAFMADVTTSGKHTPRALKIMECVIRRFTCFVESGEYIFVMPRVVLVSPPQFTERLSGYIDYMKICGLRESTISRRRKNVILALLKFDSAGIQNFSEVKPQVIYDAYEKTSDKYNFCDSLRSFFRYLFNAEVIEADYSLFIPSYRRKRPIPSVYTAAEISKLLDCIEINAASAMRSGTVILLALKLGMRSGDIANLKLSDIDFERKTIRFIQEKTQVPQCLELLPEIEESLLSYISVARPISALPYIFLTLKSPIRTISSSIVNKIVGNRFKKAGIDISERKHGGHALRMTFASELVAEKVPYDVVRKILGHEDPKIVKNYVKFDIESLRSCSIEIPPIMGKLADYMEARLGGGLL